MERSILPLARVACRLPRLTVRRHTPFQFHTARPARVAVGSPLPDVDLVEDSPGNKVNLFHQVKGRGLIIGVPAAFSTSALFPIGLPSPLRIPSIPHVHTIRCVSAAVNPTRMVCDQRRLQRRGTSDEWIGWIGWIGLTFPGSCRGASPGQCLSQHTPSCRVIFISFLVMPGLIVQSRSLPLITFPLRGGALGNLARNIEDTVAHSRASSLELPSFRASEAPNLIFWAFS